MLSVLGCVPLGLVALTQGHTWLLGVWVLVYRRFLLVESHTAVESPVATIV